MAFFNRTPNFKSYLKLGTAAGVLLMPALVSAQSSDLRIEEIIVTATKRAESIQDIPVSVAAFSGEQLFSQGISDFSELATAIPGVSLQEGGAGYRSVYIRGVSSERGNSPTTGFYLDEAYVPPGGVVQTIIEPIYFDVERVEVLRGPQGTLFGGGSMGGTLRVINNKPDPSGFAAAVGAELSGTTDGGFNYELSGMVNMPLAEDKAALRIAGTWRDRDGFIDRLVGDFSDPARAGVGAIERVEDVDDEQVANIRAALQVNATDRLTITPSLHYIDLETGGFSAFDTPTSTRDQRRQVNFDETVQDEFILGNLLVEYDLDDYQILSSTAYSNRDTFFIEDGSDFTVESFLLVPFYVETGVDGTRDEDLLTQELRFSTTGDQRLQFVTGAYYEKYERDAGLLWIIPGAAATFPAFAPFFFPNDVAFDQQTALDRRQFALFGEAEYSITEQLSLSVGLRYYDYKIETQNINRGVAENPVTANEDGVNPRISLSYDFTDEHMVYATVAKGFRPGGPNRVFTPQSDAACRTTFEDAGLSVSPEGQIEAFGSDSLWNYELGAKTQWADGRFTANVAGYYIEWDDIQQLFFPPCGFGATANFGKAEIYGLEVDFNLLLTENFSLFGGFNYNDAEIAEDIPELNVTEGTEVQSAPKWGVNLSARLDFETPLNIPGFALINYRYVDESFRDFTRNNPNKFHESYSLVNARVGLVNEDWQVAVFVDNLTDEAPAVTNFLSTFGPVASRERNFTLRPRTYGVTFRTDF